MKPYLFAAAAVLYFSTSLFAAVAPTQKEANLQISDVYVQKSHGFTDPQEILLTGVFPNGCYQWVRADVKHVDATTHEVTAIGKVAQGMCIMVLVPFTKEVDLGVLERGKHTVRVINGDGTTIEKQFDL